MSNQKNGTSELLPTQALTGPLKLHIKLASDPCLLAVVRSAVSKLAEVWGFGGESCRGVTCAVDEALSNIIKHAYKNRTDGEIELSCQTYADCLEFTFLDRGEPADRAKICAHPLDDSALGGRGTHLIRQIMDEVNYERVGEVNRLRLKKYLPGAKRKA
jgi:anti-sigma regulatory factor (Ser/Thr protein kinase)